MLPILTIKLFADITVDVAIVTMIVMLPILPPVSEEWGKVIFSVCLQVHTQGVPLSQVLSQVSDPRSFPGWYLSPGWGVGLGLPLAMTATPPPPGRGR